MAIRMTGLISGLDTESMVKELVAASSTKVDKVKQEKQILEWQKEAWQSLNTKIYNFFKGELTTFKTNSTYMTKSATASDETKVSVTAGSNAANGTHILSVKQLASSAYLTGANIKSGNGQYATYLTAGVSTNFADMTDALGNSLNLEGQTITIKSGNDTVEDLTFELGGSGDNGVANLDELNKKLQETSGYEKLQASYVDGQLVFTNASATEDEDGNTIGEIYTVESTALGLSGEVGYQVDEDAGLTNTLTGISDMHYKKEFTSSDISGTTKLADIGIAVGTSFFVNGKEFVVDDSTTMNDFTAGLSKLGVTASFDEKQGRIYINSASSGADNDFTITATDSNALDILGLGAGATKIDAQDAIIEYNGVEYRGSTNKFEINGLSITAKGVTGKYNKETGEFTDDSPLSIEVATDTQGIYDNIKKFVNAYNTLIDEMNTLYNESKTDYEPLTDEERSQLSDTQIEQWEAKAKQGLLRRDSTISSLLSNMRTILNKGVEVTMADGSKQTFTLSSLGIVTGDYSENGKLHILGDPDDATYASETNKLKQALEDNPEIFSQVFAGTKENQGFGYQMYDYLNTAMKHTESSSALTFYDDISLDSEIDDADDEIEKWEEKLQALEDKYYDQFAAMETAMAKLQQQQSYLASLMGTA
ncbi:MAG: flagellar filament capping protein FliD [Wujia sp.]